MELHWCESKEVSHLPLDLPKGGAPLKRAARRGGKHETTRALTPLPFPSCGASGLVQPPPTCVIPVSYFRVGAPRLPRLLQRLTHVPKGLRRGALGTLSSPLSYALLLHATSIIHPAVQLAKPPGSDPSGPAASRGGQSPCTC
jgi:hypothetical protein